MTSDIHQFFRDHGISEVEAIIPDMAGIARGKIMPAEKFAEEEGMRLPESIFLQTVTGEYPDEERAISPSEIDIVLKADPTTLRATWDASVDNILSRAMLVRPQDGWMQSGGRSGRHTEHLGYLLADMQFLQRAYPGATW